MQPLIELDQIREVFALGSPSTPSASDPEINLPSTWFARR
jgi:hypothetical protein